MPKQRKSLGGLLRAKFVGGPLDGETAPTMGHLHVIKAEILADSSARRWHWYEKQDEAPPGEAVYVYVGAEEGGWPKRFGSGE